MAFDKMVDKEVEEEYQNLRNDVEAQDRSTESLDVPASRGKEENNSTSTSHAVDGLPIGQCPPDWDSPDDVGNPRNWSLGRRVFHTTVPALYGFVVTVGTSTYVPAIPLIMAEFKVDREISILPLSVYTFGFTIGPIIAAPISELYGRRSVYWTTLPLLLIFTAIAGASNNIPLLIVARLFAGIGGSGSLAVGAGTIADLWDRQVLSVPPERPPPRVVSRVPHV